MDYFLTSIKLFVVIGLAGGSDAKGTDSASDELKDGMEMSASNCEHSAVFSSLPLAIKWLRDRVQQNKTVRFQVTFIILESCEHQICQYLKMTKPIVTYKTYSFFFFWPYKTYS